MVRAAASTENLPPSVEVFRADLRTSPDLVSAFQDVDVLIHLAAVVSGGEDAQFQGTVVGTERLLAAMSKSSCRRIILCSSFSVYDYGKAGKTLNEESPLHDVRDVYSRGGYTVSKWWQERVTRRISEQNGWDLVILRPGFIWGRNQAYLAALGQRIKNVHVVIGPGARIPMTHVENCADVFAKAAIDERARGKILNIVDGPGERIWSFLGDYMQRTNQPGWRVPVPYAATLAAVKLASKTVFRHATKVPGLLNPQGIESRFMPLHFDNTKLRETLDWSPPLNYQQCLDKTYGPKA